MDPQAQLVMLTPGGFLGTAGQCARAIVGLKKEGDVTASAGQTLTDRFSGAKLGAVDGQTVATLIASGYAGGDFTHIIDLYEHYRYGAAQAELKAKGKSLFDGFLSKDDGCLKRALDPSLGVSLSSYLTR